MFFASDTTAPVPPQIMDALARINTGYAPSYGADPATMEFRDRIRTVFEAPQAEVFLVTAGTAANALSLALYTPPWGSVFCHRHAHIAEDECGAPEFYSAGAKLVLVGGDHGRIDPAELAQAIDTTGTSVHGVQRGMLSLTNVTEAGTIYSTTEIAALATIAKAHGVPVHLDGARFANALIATNASPADLTWRAGVDVLSLGGTKNGLLAAEAVVLFDPGKAWELELRRKRAGHLNAKSRYIAAQINAWFDDGLWLDLARKANAAAAQLAEGLQALPDVEILHPVQANMIFAKAPEDAHARAKAAGAVYHQSDKTTCRLVASWCTTPSDVEALLACFRG